MSLEFSNRLALVTGAAQGIGRAIAKGLTDGGATVHLLDIDEVGVAKAARELDVAYHALDLSDRGEVVESSTRSSRRPDRFILSSTPRVAFVARWVVQSRRSKSRIGTRSFRPTSTVPSGWLKRSDRS